jgi:hypothetical protein
MKLGKNQELRPSGIIGSKDGKYFYWNCTISGLATFANADRFKKLVEQFGTEENLFKTFVSRPVKKYLAAGYSTEQVYEILKKNGNKLPSLNGDDSTITKVPSERKKREKKEVHDEPSQPKVQEKPIYAWQNDPTYFTGGQVAPNPLVYEEITHDVCFHPNRYLDDMCRECPLYSRCNHKEKYQPEDWIDKSKRAQREVKIKRVVFVDESK